MRSATVWIAGSAAAVIGLLVVVAAFLLDRPEEDAAPSATRPPGLPRPAEIRSHGLPTTWWGGYDPRAVDTWTHDLAERYEALYLAAGPSAIADAERRLTGGDTPAEVPSAAASSAEELEDGGRDGTGIFDR